MLRREHRYKIFVPFSNDRHKMQMQITIRNELCVYNGVPALWISNPLCLDCFWNTKRCTKLSNHKCAGGNTVIKHSFLSAIIDITWKCKLQFETNCVFITVFPPCGFQIQCVLIVFEISNATSDYQIINAQVGTLL